MNLIPIIKPFKIVQMKFQFAFVLLLAASLFSLTSCSKDDSTTPGPLVLKAIGTDVGTPITKTIPGVNITVQGNAFILDVFDAATGNKVGTLTDIDVNTEVFPDGSMRSETYTIFSFANGEDKVVLNSIVEAIPTDEVTLRAFIKPENATNNIIGGTGKYANAKGGCTLEAILDATNFESGALGFECLYEMTFQ